MMDDFPELDILVDAFPTYPRSELASRLLCASSAEVLFNELAVEAASQPEVSDGSKLFHDVDRLKELFPTANRDHLAAALHKNNGCVDSTLEQLLEADPVQKLAKITELDENELTTYLARHRNDILKALADVISHYRKRKKVRTSRVQARNGTTAIFQDVYVLHENSAESLQLKEYVWAEPALRALNYDFLMKSLKFFEGDVSRVLDVARLYIEAGCQNITFDHELGFQRREPPEDVVPSATVLRLNLPSLISPKPMGPKLGESQKPGKDTSVVTSKYSTAVREKSPFYSGRSAASHSNTSIHLAQPNQTRNKKKSVFVGSNRIDLHGFTVAEANSVVKDAVSAWWAEEKESRVSEGHMERYGSKAEFVDPLQIITGRGIHSAGGAPKIRLSVIRLLKQDGYLIDEDVGKVDVYGKKPKRN